MHSSQYYIDLTGRSFDTDFGGMCAIASVAAGCALGMVGGRAHPSRCACRNDGRDMRLMNAHLIAFIIIFAQLPLGFGGKGGAPSDASVVLMGNAAR